MHIGRFDEGDDGVAFLRLLDSTVCKAGTLRIFSKKKSVGQALSGSPCQNVLVVRKPGSAQRSESESTDTAKGVQRGIPHGCAGPAFR